MVREREAGRSRWSICLACGTHVVFVSMMAGVPTGEKYISIMDDQNQHPARLEDPEHRILGLVINSYARRFVPGCCEQSLSDWHFGQGQESRC